MVKFCMTLGQFVINIVLYRCVEVSGGSSLCALTSKNLCTAKSRIEHVLFKKTGGAQVIKSFTGHTSQVGKMVPLPTESDPARYFLSSSQDDKFVYAWWVQTKILDLVLLFCCISLYFIVESHYSEIHTKVKKKKKRLKSYVALLFWQTIPIPLIFSYCVVTCIRTHILMWYINILFAVTCLLFILGLTLRQCSNNKNQTLIKNAVITTNE